MKTQNRTHDPFRSRREREQEVDLVQKYRGIGIAAVAAAGSRTERLAPAMHQGARTPRTLIEAID